MHTYLTPGRQWQASGVYHDENGRTFNLTGHACVTRDNSEWSLDASMTVLLDTPVSFHNRYTIDSTDYEHTLAWTSINPALGQLSGSFSIIGDYIISIYSSKNGAYSGSETLIQINANTYQNVGVAFYSGKRMSAWTALLTVKPNGR